MGRFWRIVIYSLIALYIFDGRVEKLIASASPSKVYIIEEDHTSISGQLNQAETLFNLYFEAGVRDFVVEGYTGDMASLPYVPVWFPAAVQSRLLDHFVSGAYLADYVPDAVPQNPNHRLNIALPDLVTGQVSAAEFVGSVLPVRLHPGETTATYDVAPNFNNRLCEALERTIVRAAREHLKDENSANFAEYKRAYEKASGAGTGWGLVGTRTLADAGQYLFVHEALQLLAQNDFYASGWRNAAAAWDEVCSDTQAQSVVSIERMMTHYQAALALPNRDLDYDENALKTDRDFLQARSDASTEIAQRASRLARRLHRNVAIIVGAAHTEKVKKEIANETGVDGVAIAMTESFGRLGVLHLDSDQWESRSRGYRASRADNEIFSALTRLRRSPPVVKQDWYQSRLELASIADRLVSAISLYQTGAADLPKAGDRGAFVAASSVETVKGEGSELAGYLLRATARMNGAQQNLWIAAKQSGYITSDKADDPALAPATVHKLFDWLRSLAQTQLFEEFYPASETRGSPTPSVRVRLSLGVIGWIATVRDAAVNGLAYLPGRLRSQ